MAEGGIGLTWDACDRADWMALMAEVACPTLEQSWAYGAGVAHAGKARVRRAVLVRDGKTIGIVQVFEKRFSIGVTQARILRGPLFLDPEPPEDVLSRSLRRIRSEYRRRRGRFLFWQPELPDTEAARALLRACGLRRTVTGYATLTIDLAKPEDDLRACLKGPWRRAMASAEKAGLRTQVASGGPPLAWLIGEADRHRRKHGYFAPTAVQLRAMTAACAQKEAEIVAAIASEGAPVAGALVLVHGRAATYVAGWSGPQGRRRSANHLALWRAILTLKKRGVRWFDLGGVTAAAPGVARFKVGTGGTLLTLAGTYL